MTAAIVALRTTGCLRSNMNHGLNDSRQPGAHRRAIQPRRGDFFAASACANVPAPAWVRRCASSAASSSWRAAMCGLLSLSVMPDRPSPRPPVIDWPFYMASLCGPTDSHGAIAVSHRTPPGRQKPLSLCQTQVEPVKTTKGRRMSAKIAVGAKAPGFTLVHDGGGQVSLADFKGRKLVLYFYPKADTPGCTVEAKDFLEAARRPSAAPEPRFWAFRPIRCPNRTSSKPSTIFRSCWARTNPTRC